MKQRPTGTFLKNQSWRIIKLVQRNLQPERKLTMAVAARSLHNLVVLVVTRHGLITITLATLFDVTLDLHAQLTLDTTTLR